MLLRRNEADDAVALLNLAIHHPRSDFATRTAAETALREAGFEEGSAQTDIGEAECAAASQILGRKLALPSELGIAELLSRTTRSVAPESAAAPAHPDGLTDREVEILKLVALGKSNRDIGEALFITPNTVANHLKNILSKTATSNRTEAAAYGRERGLV
jgi:DNA-binding NarL/FixJ family response regulator